MKLHLVVLTPGKTEGKAIPITLAQFLIGRDPQCHLRPASALISKRHCALLIRGDKVFLRDFDSTNGTAVNEQPVKGEVELHHDDKLKVGPLLFAVRIEAAAAVSKPTPAPPTRAPADGKAPAKAPAAAAGKARPAAEKAPAPEKESAAEENETVDEKAPAPAAKAQPPAKAPPAKVPATASDDDDVAAMLLSLQDDGDAPISSARPDEIPEGSTVMDIPSPFAQNQGPGAEEPPGKDKDKDKLKSVKAEQASTSNAAKAILEKYMKRPRT